MKDQSGQAGMKVMYHNFFHDIFILQKVQITFNIKYYENLDDISILVIQKYLVGNNHHFKFKDF